MGTPARRWTFFLLLGLAALAHLTAIRSGGFIMDDDDSVTQNAALRSAEGLRDIWLRVGPRAGGTVQYYPLTYTVFWFEHALWGDRPAGYHVVNVLLHALNAVLVYWILSGLGVPGALLGAALFAVHPVHAESVAWVTELKNVLSGAFYLLSLLCFLRGRKYRALSVVLFGAALASKSATATLPAAILLILWWKNGRATRRDFVSVAPMAAMGLGAGLLTSWVERTQVGASGAEWSLLFSQRIMIAGRALWFYAGKLLWPADLMFIYPRWEIGGGVSDWLYPLSAVAALAGLWGLRKKIGRGPAAAGLYFAGTLLPALGFFDFYFMRYSFVADHFQYLASLGPLALFAAGFSRARIRGGTAAAAALAALLAGLTWRQERIYASPQSLWSDTVWRNPACWLARHNLGEALLRQGNPDAAVDQFRELLRLRPDLEDARSDAALAINSLGVARARAGLPGEAIELFREALRLRPGFADASDNVGLAERQVREPALIAPAGPTPAAAVDPVPPQP
ncbi:MAG: tetratricopeptide repeat protein [Elusimicrobiota bacterium]